MIGFLSCIVLAVTFAIIGILFAIFKEKVTKFISFSKEEQALYNKAQFSYDMRNQCFIWSASLFTGAFLSYFISSYIAIPSFIIWILLFFKEVHFDNQKAFEKYLLK